MISQFCFISFQNPAAQSPLGQMPPQDGMPPGGPMPPGFFPVSIFLLPFFVDKTHLMHKFHPSFLIKTSHLHKLYNKGMEDNSAFLVICINFCDGVNSLCMQNSIIFCSVLNAWIPV